MTILIACPVWRLAPETLVSLLHLEMEEPHHIVFAKGEPRGPGRQHHWRQCMRLWDLARRGPYEALFLVESDIIVPRNALALLLETLHSGYDAVSGLYVYRYVNGAEWNADERHEAIGKIVPASRPSWGCFLVGPRGLAIDPPQPRPPAPYCDSLWYEAAKNAGLRIALDGRVVCGHLDRNGVIYWPGEDGETVRVKSPWPDLDFPWVRALHAGVMRIKPLCAFASPIPVRHLEDGTMEAPAEVAASWVDAGLAEEVR